jgi:hypothetical protein
MGNMATSSVGFSAPLSKTEELPGKEQAFVWDIASIPEKFKTGRE